MKAIDTALICSGSPGFLRSLGSAMAGQCRLMECYSLTEAGPLMQMHRPEHVILDLRSANPQQIAKALATVSSTSSGQMTLVVLKGQMTESNIPKELQSRLRLFTLQSNELHHEELASFVLTPSTVRSPLKSADGLVTAVPSIEIAVDKPVMASGDRSTAVTSNVLNRPTAVTPDQSLMADRFRTRTPELRTMLKRLEVAARHNVTILLIGETGSGKTHLASLIHDISPRGNEPFLHVACGALPGELIESELFGHVKGAFTSAHADKDGKFLVAGNGTILLDEIDVLSPEQQVKLLRVIETGQFEMVGSNRTLTSQARLVVASNLALEPLVQQGKFRPDLYYRLSMLKFDLPPLRQRKPDIKPLARRFIQLKAKKHSMSIVRIEQEFFSKTGLWDQLFASSR